MTTMTQRLRYRELGLTLGNLPLGPNNSITDIPEVSVGHVTLISGEGSLVIGNGPVRTGVTAILPHQDNIFERKVTGAAHVINGFGKSVGFPQVNELGVIESPIMLTNTLNTWRVADATIDYLTEANPGTYSFNPVVGECNDSYLNDMVGRHVTREHVFSAIREATSPNIDEGNVGAGTGMTGWGWKGGIGTSSRLITVDAGSYVAGALVLVNTGVPSELRVGTKHIGKTNAPPKTPPAPGSIMMVVGTNCPVDSRQLLRVAKRAVFGLARVGGTAEHGSGDFVIAFSNASVSEPVKEDSMTALFLGAIEAVEEAIVNALLKAETMIGRDGNTRTALPTDLVR
jgi:D-aminopeptidase